MFDFLRVYFQKNKNLIINKWRSFVSLLIINIVFALIYYYICDDENDWEERVEDRKEDERNSIDKFFRRLYFSFAVFSTVGFGDIIPKSKKTKSIVIVQIILTMMGLLQITY